MTIASPSLNGQWIHAHEEDGPDGRVFRRAGTALPPSRGRQQLAFNADGTAVESGPGPDDRSRSRTSQWSVADHAVTLRSPDAADRRYTIAALEPDRLVLRDA